MAKINKEEFIASLIIQIEEQIVFGESLRDADQSVLKLKESANKWSALECIQHMNQSMKIYTDQLMMTQLKAAHESDIKIGWKGNFFAEGMRPKGEKISYKMKTMKNLEPNEVDNSTINNYLSLLGLIKKYIIENSQKDWSKSKVNTALGSFVKLNVAEAINFVLAHNDRHILQAKKAMIAIGV